MGFQKKFAVVLAFVCQSNRKLKHFLLDHFHRDTIHYFQHNHIYTKCTKHSKMFVGAAVASSKNEAVGAKINRVAGNAKEEAGLCCFKMKANTHIAMLENQILARQKRFGIDYLSLVDRNAPEAHLKKCIKDAIDDIEKLRDDIDDHADRIDNRASETQRRIKHAPGQEPVGVESAAPPLRRRNSKKSNGSNNSSNYNNESNRSPKKKNMPKSSLGRNIGNKSPGSLKKKTQSPSGRLAPVPFESSPPRKTMNGHARSPANSPQKSTKKPIGSVNIPVRSSPKKSPGKLSTVRSIPSKAPFAASNVKRAAASVPEEYKHADRSKWKCKEYRFAGAAKFEEKGREETVKGSLAEGLKKFKANPGKYTAMAYQSDMKDWPTNQQQYILLHRKGTVKWQP